MRKAYSAEIKAADDRSRRFVISTTEVDREGDRVLGWDLRNYRKNPVVLWAHQHREPPVARAAEVRWTGKDLRSTAEFPEPGSYAFADTVLEMIDAGILRAASVGFQAVKGEVTANDFGGLDFHTAELLEWSIVPVPANAGSLVEQAKAAGIDVRPLQRHRAKFAKKCAGPGCGHQGGSSGPDLVDELLADPDFRERALRAVVDEVWSRHVTPYTGELP